MNEGVYFLGKSFEDFFKELSDQILEQLKLRFEFKARANDHKDEWLTELEACQILKVSKPTLYSLVAEGRLVKYRIRKGIVRYRLTEIMNLLDGENYG